MADLGGGMMGPRQYPPHPSGRERFSALPDKYSNMARSPVKVVDYTVIVQGAKVLYEHFLAAATILEATAPEMLNVVGDLGVEEARRLVPYDTGATHDSIGIIGGSSKTASRTSNIGMGTYSQWWVDIGPETFYAPFLEYGTVYMTPRPFMLPALDVMAAALVGSVRAIINAVVDAESGGGGGLTGNADSMPVLSDPRVKNPFNAYRTFLYSAAKALGDINVIAGTPVFGNLRAAMYGLARGLGDVGATMNQTLGTRITNRLQGRVTGRIIGFGTASLTYGKTYSAFPGGAAGHRIYQRVVGSHTSSLGVSVYGSGSLVNRLLP